MAGTCPVRDGGMPQVPLERDLHVRMVPFVCVAAGHLVDILGFAVRCSPAAPDEITYLPDNQVRLVKVNVMPGVAHDVLAVG